MLRNWITVLAILLTTIVIWIVFFVVTNDGFQFYRRVTTAPYPDYASVISAMAGTLFAFIGIVLGGFYYFHKNDLVNKASHRSIRLEKIGTLRHLLDNQQKDVDRLLYDRGIDDPALIGQRRAVIRVFDEMSLLYDDSTSVCFTKPDLAAFVQLYSFVDKCPFLMHFDAQSRQITNRQTVESIADELDQLFLRAKSVCFNSSK